MADGGGLFTIRQYKNPTFLGPRTRPEHEKYYPNPENITSSCCAALPDTRHNDLPGIVMTSKLASDLANHIAFSSLNLKYLKKNLFMKYYMFQYILASGIGKSNLDVISSLYVNHYDIGTK